MGIALKMRKFYEDSQALKTVQNKFYPQTHFVP
jgi:hypothetical protein